MGKSAKIKCTFMLIVILTLTIIMAIGWGFKIVMITAISIYVLTSFVFLTLNSES